MILRIYFTTKNNAPSNISLVNNTIFQWLVSKKGNKVKCSISKMARSVSESKVETTTLSYDDGTTMKEEGEDNNTSGSIGGGCLKCGLDNDHANLLLCEICNDEYHTYCLDPPLMSVPDSDFYCGTFV